MSSSTICLPAHILDAHITPRARELLMLLASQTSAQEPALWICQSTIAERLRCSAVTVARSIQKLIEAKLIVETGRLHQGRYKFYHVRWSASENLKAVARKLTKPIRKVGVLTKPIEGVQLTLPPVAALERLPEPAPAPVPSPIMYVPSTPPPPAPPSTLSPPSILKDSRIAYYAEIAQKRHQESRRLHQAILQALR